MISLNKDGTNAGITANLTFDELIASFFDRSFEKLKSLFYANLKYKIDIEKSFIYLKQCKLANHIKLTKNADTKLIKFDELTRALLHEYFYVPIDIQHKVISGILTRDRGFSYCYTK